MVKNKLKFFVILLLSVALVAVFFAACGKSDEGEPPADDSDKTEDIESGEGEEDNKVEGGKISIVSKINIDTSDEPLVIPYELTGGDGPVSWSSDYASVAAVDKDGKLYPVAPGKAVITASTSTHKTEFEVNVTSVYSSYIRISSAENYLNLVKTKAYTKTTNKYCLACDIDFGGETIAPLGVWGDKSSAFNAVFDGRGYALKNFKIDRDAGCKTVNELTEETEYFGVSLFPYVNKGTIRNLNLIGVEFEGFGFTGGIAGQLESGTIENCFVQGEINSVNGFTSSVPSGGICGIIGANGTVKNCFADLEIKGGFVFAGFNFGTGGNCAARKSTISAFDDGELLFQTDSTGNGNPAEDEQLKEFENCSLISESQLDDISNFKFTQEHGWAIKEGYMPFIARRDGVAPVWAKIN